MLCHVVLDGIVSHTHTECDYGRPPALFTPDLSRMMPRLWKARWTALARCLESGQVRYVSRASVKQKTMPAT